jgi:hypothetical protein
VRQRGGVALKVPFRHQPYDTDLGDRERLMMIGNDVRHERVNWLDPSMTKIYDLGPTRGDEIQALRVTAGTPLLIGERVPVAAPPADSVINIWIG